MYKLSLLFGSLCLYSCTQFFAPSMYLQGEMYMSKPILSPQDSLKKHKASIYATFQAGASVSPSIYARNPTHITSANFQIHQAHSFKYLNLAYGLYGGAGKVNIPFPIAQDMVFPYLPQEAGNKKFKALGFRLEANLKLPTDDTYFEARPIGFFINRSHEFGDYLQFRRGLLPARFLNYSESPDMFSWGIYTEMCWLYGQHNPSKRGTGFFWKLAYIESRFQDFVTDLNGTVGNFAIRRDLSLTFVFRLKPFDFSYQMFFSPVPFLSSKGDAFSLTANLSDIFKIKKKTKI